MKITSFRKIFLSLSAVVFVSSAVFSQEAEEGKNQKKNADIWKFYEQTAAAYYFKSDYVSGGDHFAPITGLFNSFELKTTFNAECKIPAPLGKHFLLKDSNIRIKTAFELCPVTVRPLVSVSFTPLPFFVFSTGASIGTGWSALGFKGLCKLDENGISYGENGKISKNSIEYENLTPFGNYYYDFWFSGLFQFDTGAIFQGNWTHAVMQASYTVSYVGVTGVDDGKNLAVAACGKQLQRLAVYCKFCARLPDAASAKYDCGKHRCICAFQFRRLRNIQQQLQRRFYERNYKSYAQI